ncbi:14716_t:CDS:2, partial [Racocetra persica]
NMDFRNELNQLQLQGEAHNHPKKPKPSHYPNDRTQIGLLGSLLVGPALAWFALLLEKESPLLEDFDGLLGSSKLPSGTQTSDLDWGKAALIDQFRIGLKNDVKDLLLTIEDPISLNNAIAKAVRCDNRLFE